MGVASAGGGHAVGTPPPVPHPRPGSGLRSRLPGARRAARDPDPPHAGAGAPRERRRGAAGRDPTPRVLRPPHRAQRTAPTGGPGRVRCLLQRRASAPRAGARDAPAGAPTAARSDPCPPRPRRPPPRVPTRGVAGTESAPSQLFVAVSATLALILDTGVSLLLRELARHAGGSVGVVDRVDEPRRLLGRRTARPVRSRPPRDEHRRADALAGDGDR